MLGEELVQQDGAVVADQLSAHAAVVVLVPHAPAAAGVVPAVTDQALFVLILAVLPVGHPSTGSPFAVEARARGNHRSPSVGAGRADRPPARGIGRMCAYQLWERRRQSAPFRRGVKSVAGAQHVRSRGARLECRQPTVPADESREVTWHSSSRSRAPPTSLRSKRSASPAAPWTSP